MAQTLKKCNSGFTLIETLIAVLLLAIVLAGGIALYFSADQLMALAVHKKLATELAGKEMEELRLIDYALLTNSIKAKKLGDLDATQTVTITQPDPNYKRIDLELQWTEFNQTEPHMVDLVTFVGP